jgi:hypothetical protein
MLSKRFGDCWRLFIIDPFNKIAILLNNCCWLLASCDHYLLLTDEDMRHSPPLLLTIGGGRHVHLEGDESSEEEKVSYNSKMLTNIVVVCLCLAYKYCTTSTSSNQHYVFWCTGFGYRRLSLRTRFFLSLSIAMLGSNPPHVLLCAGCCGCCSLPLR